ncbi:uncharacterized protein PAC_11415 [Phialocephala subalpina]|uniref:Uncharacterized protein n=1 Tax=Phialocephala subalpina TaxID=576137 RepID=A0A1L7X904_9HELO|nr:uncharacterized protein PAC_11415 [Phialocephala subalpina]
METQNSEVPMLNIQQSPVVLFTRADISHRTLNPINGEAFQNAIAANLAKLIKPSIKSALDTIQPLIEAVYTHELLLQKTNQSVEHILERLESNAEHTAKRESIIDSAYAPPGTPPDKPADAALEEEPVARSVGGATPILDYFKLLLDENNAKTTATLSGLSGSIESNTTKITEVAQGVVDITASLGPTKESIDVLKSSSEQSNTTTSLDLISTDLAALKGHSDTTEKIEAISSELGALKAIVEAGNASNTEGFTNVFAAVGEHSAHAAALSEIRDRSLGAAPALTVISEDSPIDHSAVLSGLKADLESLKENIQARIASNSENVTGLKAKIDTVLIIIEGQKAEDPSAEILAAVKQSNESHASHAATLEGIKSVNSEAPPPADTGDVGTQISAIASKLDEHTATLDEIKTTGGSHATVLESHGTSLEGIRSLGASAPAGCDNITVLESQIAAIIATLESDGSSLDEIRTSSGSHTAALENHGASLEGINSLSVTPAAKGNLEAQIAAILTALDSHSSALNEIKIHSLVLNENKTATTTHAVAVEDIRSPGISRVPAADTGNLAALKTQVGSIISTLNTHSTAWNEIKERSASETPVSKEIVSIPDDVESYLDGPFATVIEILMLHTNLLNKIKEDVSAEILTALHNIGQAQVNHTNLLTEIREGDVSDEILTLLHASGESHAAHSAVLDEIKSQSLEPAAPTALDDHSAHLVAIKDATTASDESHTAHASSLDELKSRSVEPTSSDSVNLGGLEAQIGGIVTKLDDHSAHLAVIKDATTASNDSHVAHAAILGEIKATALASNESHTAHASTLAEINEATSASNESHSAHATTLSELKDATSALNDNHSTYAATLSEIKDATLAFNNAHTSHTAAFTELKSIQRSAAATSTQSSDSSALETHITTILNTLEGQTATLSEIGEKTASPKVLAAIEMSHELLSTNHYGALVKALHTETKDSQANLAQAIGALAIGEAAKVGATALLSQDDDESSSVLKNFKAVKALVEAGAANIVGLKQNLTSMTTQLDFNHTAITTSLTTLSDELKAEIDATGTQITESITTLSGDVKGIPATDLSALNTSLDQHKTDLDAITTKLDGLDNNIKDTSSHIVQLHDGVYFNKKDVRQLQQHTSPLANGVYFSDRGVELLKDHTASVPRETAKPISEGAWFKSSSPGYSRVVSRSAVKPEVSVVDDDSVSEVEAKSKVEEAEKDFEPEAPVAEEPIAEEPIAEEPIAEEPVAEEPIAEESTHAPEPETEIVKRQLQNSPVVEAEPIPEESSVEEEAVPEVWNAEIVDETLPTKEPAVKEPISIEPEGPVEELKSEEVANPEPEVQTTDKKVESKPIDEFIPSTEVPEQEDPTPCCFTPSPFPYKCSGLSW